MMFKGVPTAIVAAWPKARLVKLNPKIHAPIFSWEVSFNV
jgi:hypothetical protein